MLPRDGSVYLCRGEFGMTEKILHRAQICTVLQQVRRIGVTKRMRIRSGPSFDDPADSALSEWTPPDSEPQGFP